MKRLPFPALAAIWLLFLTVPVETGAGSPVPLHPRLSHGGSELVLRSTSLKEATFLRVNVYWVGLYLSSSKTPPDSIFSASQVKAFVFHFLRNVKSSTLGEAWIKDLTASCEHDCKSVLAQARVLARKMPDIRSSQKIAYVLFPDRVDVVIDGMTLGSLRGANASRAVLATFLGPTAPLGMRNDLIRPLGPSAGRH